MARSTRTSGRTAEEEDHRGIAWDSVASTATVARRRVEQWYETVLREIDERPVRTVALAVGAGYVLGGGILSRLTFRMVGVAARLILRVAVVPVMVQGILAITELDRPADHAFKVEKSV